MKEFFLQEWLKIAFGMLVAAFGVCYRRLRKRLDDQDILKMSVQALLRDRIVESYNRYAVDKGCCPIYAMESIQALYAQYNALGGNGTVTNLMQKLESLPTEPAKKEG